MSTYETILKRRSIRRFRQISISYRILRKLINAARLAPSGANLQPCEFVIVDKKELVEGIFLTLRWAAYLGKKGAPSLQEKPTVFIVALFNKGVRQLCGAADIAAAVENILLVATEEGLGSCWIASIDKLRIQKILNIPKNYSVEYVVALGYPKEKSVIEDFKKNQRYWRDKRGLLHVPKRRLNDILHRNRFR